jgi:hypothetical protein
MKQQQQQNNNNNNNNNDDDDDRRAEELNEWSGDKHNLPLAEDIDDDANISVKRHFSSMKQ